MQVSFDVGSAAHDIEVKGVYERTVETLYVLVALALLVEDGPHIVEGVVAEDSLDGNRLERVVGRVVRTGCL